jgi:hypothetical protein
VVDAAEWFGAIAAEQIKGGPTQRLRAGRPAVVEEPPAIAATIATASGGKLTFRKCANEPGRVLAWELSRQEDAQ